ncbi:MAG: carbamoyltransferase HypF [Holophagales bacterium]|nr:carbamoyltransferase HypF [Holophagales bacterium]
MSEVRRLRVEVTGAVQGVGFRPFVFRLATQLGLSGWVLNDVRGVEVEVEGDASSLDAFRTRLEAEAPPRAVVRHVSVSWLPPEGFSSFEIRMSTGEGEKSVSVLPDLATCGDCLAELDDPADRRYRYPFLNCTNCGPRFTIVRALPYDRQNTTMRGFTLCAACRREYEEPRDRRFHAQPTACPACGPRLALWNRIGQVVAREDEALRGAAAALLDGRVVAVKGLGGFHLCCDARNEDAVARLRAGKVRREKPLAVMVRDVAAARALCEVSGAVERWLLSPEAPILLLPRLGSASATALVAPNVAPESTRLGVMLPSTPLHHLLLAAVDAPLVATSGNLSDEPIATDEREAVARLGSIADLFLVHDRPVERHVDDSVGWLHGDALQLLRRARGFAPLPVPVRVNLPPILAVGAHLKNVVGLGLGSEVVLSQHVGDLETPEALAAFERVVADLLRLWEAAPVAIAHDLHPDYLSTRWARRAAAGDESEGPLPPAILAAAREGRLRLVPVQHHHAHLASCLAENGVEGPALGVTWDGTGYGTDGTVWGGEFLLGDAAGYTRVAHLRPFRLPGGDAAVKEPRRAALALLFELFGEAALGRDDLSPVASFSGTERALLARMLATGTRSPVTTSAGRLFDAVAALVGLHPKAGFEGQAAMALEALADPSERGAYPFPLVAGAVSGAPATLDWGPLAFALLEDGARGVGAAIRSGRFHNALVDGIAAVARLAGAPRVALSGGCFQNRLLLERASARLAADGFQVLTHRLVPPNDGGIALGQVLVAAARISAEG